MRRVVVYFLLLLSFFETNIFSQQKKLDSLTKVFQNKQNHDTIRLKAIHSIGWFYYINKPDTTIILAKTALEFSRKSKQKHYEGESLRMLGATYLNKGEYSISMEYYLKTIKVFEEIHYNKGIAMCLMSLGNIYSSRSDYPKGLAYYFKSLKVAQTVKMPNGKIGDQSTIATCYYNIGIIYRKEFDPKKALEYYNKSLAIRELIGDKKGIASCFMTIGNIYLDKKELDKALFYQFKAQKTWEKLGEKSGLAVSYSNIAAVYTYQLKYDEALEYFRKALNVMRSIGYKTPMVNSYSNIADLLNGTAKYELALKYSDSCVQLAKEIGDLNGERLGYEHKSNSNAYLKRYKEAYEYHKKFKKLTDSIFNEENSQALGDLKTNFEVEKKEAELKVKAISDQEKIKAVALVEQKKQQAVIISGALVLLIVVIFSVVLLKRFRHSEKQNKIIEKQKVLVDEAFDKLREKNKEVMDSIHYAQRIQKSLLPSDKYITRKLEELISKK